MGLLIRSNQRKYSESVLRTPDSETHGDLLPISPLVLLLVLPLALAQV